MPNVVTIDVTVRSREDTVVSPGASLNLNLVAHWHLDEASGTRIDSIGGNDLTPTGTVTQVAGKLGSAVSFPGTATNNLRRTSAINPANWPANGQFEVNGWVYLNSTATQGFFWIASAGSSRQTTFEYSSGGPTWQLYSNSQGLFNFSMPATTGQWYNLSVGDDGTQAFGYVNNVLLQTAARGTAINSTAIASITIGASDSGSGEPANGRVDCVSLWLGRSLTTTERTYLYNAGAGRDYPY